MKVQFDAGVVPPFARFTRARATVSMMGTNAGRFLCPECGSSNWLSFMEAYATVFGPAEVLLMPHAVSITVGSCAEKRYSEDDPRLQCAPPMC
jgi:hypothetical protein